MRRRGRLVTIRFWPIATLPPVSRKFYTAHRRPLTKSTARVCITFALAIGKCPPRVRLSSRLETANIGFSAFFVFQPDYSRGRAGRHGAIRIQADCPRRERVRRLSFRRRRGIRSWFSIGHRDGHRRGERRMEIALAHAGVSRRRRCSARGRVARRRVCRQSALPDVRERTTLR